MIATPKVSPFLFKVNRLGFKVPRKSNSQLMRLRAKRGLSQEDIAQALRVTKKTVSNWETGYSTPKLTPRQFKDLLDILQIGSDELPDRFGPPENDEDISPLKRLRQEAGISMEELATILSSEDKQLTPEEIQVLEGKEKVTFTILQVQALCRAFQVSLDELAALF